MSAQITASRLFGLLLFATLTAMAMPAQADSSYQPYYLKRDTIQYTNTGVKMQPESRDAVQYAKTGVPSTGWTTPTPRYNGIPLSTKTGFEAGLMIGSYGYSENLLDKVIEQKQNGINFGATASGTVRVAENVFIGGDLRLAYSENGVWSRSAGRVDSASGGFLADGRIVVGGDYVQDGDGLRFGLSPYLGLGIRNLYASADEANVYGYNSTYYYAPFGVTGRFRVTQDSRISVNAEYDVMLLARQNSYLSDLSSNTTDADTWSRKGYGLRSSVAYEKGPWSVGPYVTYWNVNTSKTVNYTNNGVADTFAVPRNKTLEYGALVRYRFK